MKIGVLGTQAHPLTGGHRGAAGFKAQTGLHATAGSVSLDPFSEIPSNQDV